MRPSRADPSPRVIVLGAGPAGLAAALALVRAGAHVRLVEAGPTVGGLCVTTRRDGFTFDLGGHILFVHTPAREAWLRELLGADLVHVDRPVACVSDGEVLPGRYFDQAGPLASRPPQPPGPGVSAEDYLSGVMPPGAAFEATRRYMEKVDGVPMDVITGIRCHKLFTEQYAPDGWWYPAGGVGQLMDAMARAIRAGGGEIRIGNRVEGIATSDGRVTGVRVTDAGGVATALPADAVVAGVPPALTLRLLDDAPPPPEFPARAAAVVALAIDAPRVSDEPWIQVDDPSVPFSRLAEPRNWSARLAPPDRTAVTCEVYCSPTSSDPWWPLPDDELAGRCRDGLVHLGLLPSGTSVRSLEVIRRPRAWSVVPVGRVEEMLEATSRLAAVSGLVSAQGGDVIQAVDAGEEAAHAALAEIGAVPRGG